MTASPPSRFSRSHDTRARRAGWVRRVSSREARYGDPTQQPPSLSAPADFAPPPEFAVGDEVRVRGARCVVVKVGPEGVMVRGTRCPAGWISAADVEECT